LTWPGRVLSPGVVRLIDERSLHAVGREPLGSEPLGQPLPVELEVPVDDQRVVGTQHGPDLVRRHTLLRERALRLVVAVTRGSQH
jgi:hypothetical protein